MIHGGEDSPDMSSLCYHGSMRSNAEMGLVIHRRIRMCHLCSMCAPAFTVLEASVSEIAGARSPALSTVQYIVSKFQVKHLALPSAVALSILP